ncbi:hypothetical protein ACLB2K_030956 [Fragaria x ananassa]
MMRITSSCCFHPTTTVVVFISNYMSRTRRAFHSQPSDPARSRETHRGDLVPRVRYLEHALNVFDEMLQRRSLPSVVRFNQILVQLVKNKHYSPVIAMSKQMVRCRIRPNQYTLSIIMNCFCHLNQMGFSLSVLGHFFKLGLRPDVVAYSTLINGFVLKNRIQEAAGIFSKMLQGGHCVPNVVTFGTIIKGLCRRGDNNAAIQLLRKMDERGCEANIVIYSTIIDGLCKDTLVVDAMNLFSEMISRGIAPNVVTYTSLIQGVCDIGQWQEATRLLNEMATINIYPNIVTYNVLVDGLCKDEKVVEANSVVEIMI